MSGAMFLMGLGEEQHRGADFGALVGVQTATAILVDLAEPHLRARSVGLYYLIRSLAITPAAFVGGLLWEVAPSAPFYVAGAIGAVGTLLFAVTVDEGRAA